MYLLSSQFEGLPARNTLIKQPKIKWPSRAPKILPALLTAELSTFEQIMDRNTSLIIECCGRISVLLLFTLFSDYSSSLPNVYAFQPDVFGVWTALLIGDGVRAACMSMRPVSRCEEDFWKFSRFWEAQHYLSFAELSIGICKSQTVAFALLIVWRLLHAAPYLFIQIMTNTPFCVHSFTVERRF